MKRDTNYTIVDPEDPSATWHTLAKEIDGRLFFFRSGGSDFSDPTAQVKLEPTGGCWVDSLEWATCGGINSSSLWQKLHSGSRVVGVASSPDKSEFEKMQERIEQLEREKAEAVELLKASRPAIEYEAVSEARTAQRLIGYPVPSTRRDALANLDAFLSRMEASK